MELYMELYIKDNLNDISYLSELILDTNTMTFKKNLTCQGLIRRRLRLRLTSLSLRKSSAH